MRKISVYTASIFVMTAMMAGCGGHHERENKENDSVALLQDTLPGQVPEVVDAEAARLDSIRQDSIWQAEAVELYKGALTVTPENKKKNQVPETTFYKVEWSCLVTNKSGVAMLPADYQVAYDETYEDGNADGLFNVTRERTLKGVALMPDSTTTMVLTGRANTQDLSNPRIKMLISQDDFINRYKDARKAEAQTLPASQP